MIKQIHLVRNKQTLNISLIIQKKIKIMSEWKEILLNLFFKIFLLFCKTHSKTYSRSSYFLVNLASTTHFWHNSSDSNKYSCQSLILFLKSSCIFGDRKIAKILLPNILKYLNPKLNAVKQIYYSKCYESSIVVKHIHLSKTSSNYITNIDSI